MLPKLDKFRNLHAKASAVGTADEMRIFEKTVLDLSDNYEAVVAELRRRGAFKSLPEIHAPAATANNSFMKSNLLSDRELGKYSITRAIKSALAAAAGGRNSPLPDGLEGDVSKALASRLPESAVKGFLVPFECLKTLNATVGNQGGMLAQGTTVMEPLDVLRAQSVVGRAGALLFENVKNKLTFPRQAGGATGQWLSEIGTIQANDAPWEALSLVPHRLGAMTKFTNELLMQSGGTVEDWARRELLGAVATAIDKGALSGDGGVEPLGIANSAVVQNIVFGAVASRGKMLEMEGKVSDANAPDDNICFIASPTVRQKLKNIVSWTGSHDTLWTDDGRVVGRPAFATKNAPGDRMICGAFNHYAVAMFGVLDILVNPYNEDAQGVIRVTVNAFADCGELYPKSFCVSTDSASQ